MKDISDTELKEIVEEVVSSLMRDKPEGVSIPEAPSGEKESVGSSPNKIVAPAA